MRSRNSQWGAWLSFCDDEDRVPLPVTEAHLVAFVGWLAVERERGRRSVGSSSIPQYISAVRQMQLLLTGTPVPSYPMMVHVLRGYARWEEAKYPKQDVRCGVPASVVQRVWGLGMRSATTSVVRDAAMCVFAYCFNGLRESSVASLESRHVHLSPEEMKVRLTVVKGREASLVPLANYTRLGELSSPLDLWLRWAGCRGEHPRFFALPGERMSWSSGSLTRALGNCLHQLGVTPPAEGKYTSHSLRIGAHTEQVLLGISLEVRLARFGWGPRSQDMAALYFDRTIRLSPASFWLFGRPPAAVLPASTPLM